MQTLPFGGKVVPSDRGVFPYSAILWDIDGTLVDSEPVHRLSFLDTCKVYGITLPKDFHDRLIGKSEETIHQLLVDDFELSISLPRWSENRFGAFLARIEEVHAIPLARKIWHTASELGIPQGVVSNSPRRIVWANLERFGLNPDDIAIVCRDDVKHGKPNPAPYQLASDRLSLDPAAVAVVEDSAAGLESARAAGMSVFMMSGFTDDRQVHQWQPIEILQDALVRSSPTLSENT